MELISATDQFKLNGQTYAGFPIVLDSEMRGVAVANAFLRWYLTRGAIGSRKSWPSTGQAIYDYFSFLEAHELAWNTERSLEEHSLVAAYRDYCLDKIRLAQTTVSQRLLYVCEFYEYALRNEWITKLPFGFEERRAPRRQDSFAHLDRFGGTLEVRDVFPRRHKALIEFLAKDQIRSILGAATNPHHRMMVRLALQTGLRREEIATFPVAYVFDPDKAGRTEKNIRIHLDPLDGHGMRTKGSKERHIYIGRSLLSDLWFYAIHLRGERAHLNPKKVEPLFLNQFGRPFAADGKGFEPIVRNIWRFRLMRSQDSGACEASIPGHVRPVLEA